MEKVITIGELLGASVHPMCGDANYGVSMGWRDGEGNKETSFALLEPGKEASNRAGLIATLVRGALKLGAGEELNDDACFSDVLRLVGGEVTSRKEYAELRAKVYDPISCHEKFQGKD